MDDGRGFDDFVPAALGDGPLASLERNEVERLLGDAVGAELALGRVIHETDMGASLSLVVSGPLRLHLTAPGGRQVTVAYARRGAIRAAVGVVGHGHG